MDLGVYNLEFNQGQSILNDDLSNPFYEPATLEKILLSENCEVTDFLGFLEFCWTSTKPGWKKIIVRH